MTGISRKASIIQLTEGMGNQYECLGELNNSPNDGSLNQSSSIRGKRNSIDKGSINCLPIYMRNRDFFLEDYSKDDIKALYINNSLSML